MAKKRLQGSNYQTQSQPSKLYALRVIGSDACRTNPHRRLIGENNSLVGAPGLLFDNSFLHFTDVGEMAEWISGVHHWIFEDADERTVEAHLNGLEACELARRTSDGKARVTIIGEELLELDTDELIIIGSSTPSLEK